VKLPAATLAEARPAPPAARLIGKMPKKTFIACATPLALIVRPSAPK